MKIYYCDNKYFKFMQKYFFDQGYIWTTNTKEIYEHIPYSKIGLLLKDDKKLEYSDIQILIFIKIILFIKNYNLLILKK